MIKTSTRRVALAVALGTSTLVSFGVARAQTTAPKATPNGITGTDPVPKGCGCVTAPPPTSDVSPSSPVTQAMLILLGLA